MRITADYAPLILRLEPQKPDPLSAPLIYCSLSSHPLSLSLSLSLSIPASLSPSLPLSLSLSLSLSLPRSLYTCIPHSPPLPPSLSAPATFPASLSPPLCWVARADGVCKAQLHIPVPQSVSTSPRSNAR